MTASPARRVPTNNRLGRTSTVSRLPAAVQETIRRKFADGLTIDQLAAHLRARGIAVSRSALARFRRRTADDIERRRAIAAFAASRGYRRAAPGADERGAEEFPDLDAATAQTWHVLCAAIGAAAVRVAAGAGDCTREMREIAMMARALRDLSFAATRLCGAASPSPPQTAEERRIGT